jgi:hypothetical protein
MHVTWGPEAASLSDEERTRIVADLKSAADAHHEQHLQAEKALEGLPFVAVPIDQLADIYGRLKRLTHMGQASIEEWNAMPKAEQTLRHAIFAEADFGALYAGQWLPHEIRDRVFRENRKARS